MLPERLPRWFILLADLLIPAAGVAMAYLLRFNFAIPAHEMAAMPLVILLVAGTRGLVSAVVIYSGRYGPFLTLTDALNVAVPVIAGSFLLLAGDVVSYFFITGTLFIPLTILILEFLVTAPLTITLRALRPTSGASLHGPPFTLIYGTGPAALGVKAMLLRSHGRKANLLGFIGEPGPTGRLEGISVLTLSDLPALLRRTSVQQVILTRNDLPAIEKEALLDFCLSNRVTLFCLPGQDTQQGNSTPTHAARQNTSYLREVSLADFMTLGTATANQEAIHDLVRGKTILITGAAGKLGKALTNELTNLEPAKIILVDQDEQGISEINCELRIANCELPEVNYELRIANCELPYAPCSEPSALSSEPCALCSVPCALRPMPCARRHRRTTPGTFDLCEVSSGAGHPCRCLQHSGAARTEP